MIHVSADRSTETTLALTASRKKLLQSSESMLTTGRETSAPRTTERVVKDTTSATSTKKSDPLRARSAIQKIKEVRGDIMTNGRRAMKQDAKTIRPTPNVLRETEMKPHEAQKGSTR